MLVHLVRLVRLVRLVVRGCVLVLVLVCVV